MANSFKNKKVDLTTTDLTTLYTVPTATTTVVKSLLVTEDAGSGSTITITLVNSSGTIFNLFKDKAIALALARVSTFCVDDETVNGPKDEPVLLSLG